MFNERISTPSSNPSSPPYYDLTSNSEHSDIPDPPSPTLAELRATTDSKKTSLYQNPLTPFHLHMNPLLNLLNTYEPIHKPSEPTFEPIHKPSKPTS